MPVNVPSSLRPRRARKSWPLRPTVTTWTRAPVGRSCSRMSSVPRRMMLVFSAPARPRSGVTSSTPTFCTSRCTSSGCSALAARGASAAELGDERPHRFGVRPRRRHAHLRPPQPRSRHQLHGLGDLGGVADRPDAAPDVALGDGIERWPLRSDDLLLELVDRRRAARRSSSSESALSFAIVSTISGCAVSMKRWNSVSQARTLSTGTSSRKPLVSA